MACKTPRVRLVFAAVAIIITTGILPGSPVVHTGVFWATMVAVAGTGISSLFPACGPTLNRVGALIVAAEIAVLVAATGGAGSPYDVLYGMLLIYATMFYGTRRLITTAALLLGLFVAPHALTVGHHIATHWTRVAVEIGVWAVIASVTHGLIDRVRTQTSALSVSEQRYRCLFSENPDPVFSLDRDGRFTTINAAAGRLLKRDPATLVGSHFHPFVAAEQLPGIVERFQAVLGGEPQDYELTVLDADGWQIAAAVTNFPIVVHGCVVGVHGTLKDISDRKAMQERLTQAALHDPLTGLANRVLLADRLRHALIHSKRTGEPVTFMTLDLDGFKPVNDTHGHAVGDALLVEIAGRLADCSRPGDTLARLGGDEFSLVLPGADRGAAVKVTQRILDAISRPVVVEEMTLVIGASIGVTVSAAALATGQQLLHEADAAMYAAKHRGRGCYVVFSPTLERTSPGSVPVDPRDARAWAAYMTALRAEIAQRKEAGVLPEQTRAPASVLRVLQSLLVSIGRLPHDAALAGLPLPERVSLEEFVFHQAMVHDWAANLVHQGRLTTRRPPEADRFWSHLETTVLGDRNSTDDLIATS